MTYFLLFLIPGWNTRSLRSNKCPAFCDSIEEISRCAVQHPHSATGLYSAIHYRQIYHEITCCDVQFPHSATDLHSAVYYSQVYHEIAQLNHKWPTFCDSLSTARWRDLSLCCTTPTFCYFLPFIIDMYIMISLAVMYNIHILVLAYILPFIIDKYITRLLTLLNTAQILLMTSILLCIFNRYITRSLRSNTNDLLSAIHYSQLYHEIADCAAQ